MRTMTEEEHNKLIKKSRTIISETKDAQGRLHSFNDKPARIRGGGIKEWRKHGKMHRDNDLPAWDSPTCVKDWYQNGKLHREKGPARIKRDGEEHYYLNGKPAHLKDSYHSSRFVGNLTYEIEPHAEARRLLLEASKEGTICYEIAYGVFKEIK